MAVSPFARYSFWPCQFCCYKHHSSRAPKSNSPEREMWHAPSESKQILPQLLIQEGFLDFSTWCYRSVNLKWIKQLRRHKPGLEAVCFAVRRWQMALCLFVSVLGRAKEGKGLLFPWVRLRPLDLSAQCPLKKSSLSLRVCLEGKVCVDSGCTLVGS